MKRIKNIIYNLLNSQVSFPIPSYGGWLYGWKPIKLLYPHEPETVAFFKKNIKPGMKVADVGANVGFFTLLFSMLVGKNGRVIAYEPDIISYERLSRVSGKNVTHFHSAVGKPGRMTLYGRPGSGRNSLMFKEWEPVEEVDVVSLPLVDFAKIDVEGGEIEVLKNMPKIPCTIEYAAKLAPEDFLDEVVSLGYEIFQILPDGETQALIKSTLPKLGHCNLFLRPIPDYSRKAYYSKLDR